MAYSNHGITRTGRGEEQPTDRKRAQTADQVKTSENSPSKEATRTEVQNSPSRSGSSRED
jgi:hypothetical protein